MGNVDVAYGVFIQILCYAVLFLSLFPRENTKCLENDTNFTILGHSLNTRDLILKVSLLLEKYG